MAARRQFSREFKLETVRLVKERGVSVAQAARDLELHQTVLRSWIRELAVDPQQAFPGKGVMEAEQAELERLRCGKSRHDKLLTFSCRQRACPPSCAVLRISQTAAHLVGPYVPIQESAPSLPIPLRVPLVGARAQG
jgi:transposase